MLVHARTARNARTARYERTTVRVEYGGDGKQMVSRWVSTCFRMHEPQPPRGLSSFQFSQILAPLLNPRALTSWTLA
jgi:hypothetical protein